MNQVEILYTKFSIDEPKASILSTHFRNLIATHGRDAVFQALLGRTDNAILKAQLVNFSIYFGMNVFHDVLGMFFPDHFKKKVG